MIETVHHSGVTEVVPTEKPAHLIAQRSLSRDISGLLQIHAKISGCRRGRAREDAYVSEAVVLNVPKQGVSCVHVNAVSSTSVLAA